jgi:hypothetical protein
MALQAVVCNAFSNCECAKLCCSVHVMGSQFENWITLLTSTRAFVNNSTDKCVLATSGFQADGDYLVKMMKTRLVMYKHQNGDDMSCEAIAHMLSTILYGRRFFPLYTFNIIGGIDSEGTCSATPGLYSRCGFFDSFSPFLPCPDALRALDRQRGSLHLRCGGVLRAVPVERIRLCLRTRCAHA